MIWSAQELSAFFGAPVLPPETPDLPHSIRFGDDLISGELWIIPEKKCAVVMVHRGSSHEHLFEFTAPCELIKTDFLKNCGTPALFFFTGKLSRSEGCSLCIAKHKASQFAFYPVLRSPSSRV